MSEDVPKSAPILQSCPDCAAVLDISEEEPLSSVTCPVCGAPMRARTQFNNFTLQMQIGVGGMGAVYRALDTKLNRLVALKVVLKQYSSDPTFHAKFEHEARMAAAVNHHNVVKVYSFGSDHGLFYIAMELVDKGSMDELIVKEGRVPELQALEIGIQIAQGLKAAWHRGLIHRDVKPGNVLFSDANTAKIVDFGLALPMEHTAGPGKSNEEVWGTPYYIAPEKLSHEPEDFRSDIYSLGASLFHALAGRPMFEAETNSISTLRRLKSQETDLQAVAPDISSATAYVINRTLREDPKERPQSYDELIEHLNYAHEKLVKSGGKSRLTPERTIRDKRSRKKVRFGLVMLALMLVVGLLFLVLGNRVFKKENNPAGESGKQAAEASSPDEKYRLGRKQLLRGDFSAAQNTFHDLGQREDVPHPLDRWVVLHEGLSALLGGNLAAAQIAFGKMSEAGLYSDAPEDRALANFFVEMGRIGSTSEPVPQAAGTQYNPENCESIGLLICALDDWEQAHYEDASALFHDFVVADPKPPYDWIAQYRPLAQKYVADYDAYKKITSEINAADSPKQQTEALEDLKVFKGNIHLPGKLAADLLQTETNLQNKVAARVAEEQRKAAQLAWQHEQDTRTLEEASARFASSIHGYQFEEGLAAVEKVVIIDPEALTQKAELLKKAQWLVQFKETLINDLNVMGYSQPVFKINSAPIEGGVHKATKDQIEIQTQYGALIVPWGELPASEILAIADYFTKKSVVPGIMADRLWLAGVFAMETGMKKEGKDFLDRAAKIKGDYYDQMALFAK